MVRVLPRTRTEKYAALLELLEKAFQERVTPIQGFLDEQNNRVTTETDAMIEHDR